MNYKNHGEAFREIRLNKGMSLSDIEYISGVSKSTISQFENGKLMLSFDKLERALSAMYVTYYDYAFVVNHGQTEYFIAQFDKIENLSLKNDYSGLEEVYKVNLKNNEKGTDLIALCAKVYYSKLDKSEIEVLEDYLASGLEWSLYDIRVVVNIIEQINLDVLIVTLKDLCSTKLSAQYIDELATYRKPIIWILIRSCLVFIKNKMVNEAQLMIDKLSVFAKRSDFTAKLGLYFIRGCYQSIFGSKAEGDKMIKKLCMILEEIDAKEMSTLLAYSYGTLNTNS